MTRRGGVTLIELVVALTVFAIVGAAMGVTLRNGLRAWDRINRLGERQQQIRFALALLERDAAQATLLTGANDAGEPPLFTDAALHFVMVRYPDASQLPQLERVLVRAETSTDGTTALVRRTAPYPAAPDGPLGHAQILLTGVAACQFAYLYSHAATKQWLWRPAWETTNEFPDALPRGIRITIQSAADPAAPVTHVYEIPIGLPGFTEETP